MSPQRPINKDAYKYPLGMRAWCAYLFHKAIASLRSATSKVSREVCRGKQGQLKVFAYVPLLCESAVKVKLGAATCSDSQTSTQWVRRHRSPVTPWCWQLKEISFIFVSFHHHCDNVWKKKTKKTFKDLESQQLFLGSNWIQRFWKFFKETIIWHDSPPNFLIALKE